MEDSNVVKAELTVKKTWETPRIELLSADIIEGSSNTGNDGGGVSTGS
ncbi:MULTISPECIES: hypothetical protein [Emticicia]|nr:MULTISPECIES: hypothetical protein [Emticicia]UTA66423.1 hypothetical protein MB380_12520 [Emticicia sp. 21SJ11W-3]